MRSTCSRPYPDPDSRPLGVGARWRAVVPFDVAERASSAERARPAYVERFGVMDLRRSHGLLGRESAPALPLKALARLCVAAFLATSCVVESGTPTVPRQPEASPVGVVSPETVGASPALTPMPAATPTPAPSSSPPRTAAHIWQDVRAQYAWIPELEIRTDPRPGIHYLGIRNGMAVVGAQLGATLGEHAVWHEAGHAALDAAAQVSGASTEEILSAYWSVRGLPGTWQDQEREATRAAAAGVTGEALHRMWPTEMLADTFAATALATYRDGQLYPDVPLDRERLALFYSHLPALIPEGVRNGRLLLPRGEWAFVRRVASPAGANGDVRAPTIGEIWAVPLDGADARIVARYVSSVQPDIGDANGRLAAQLSQDGRRLLLSVAQPSAGRAWRRAIVVLDLLDGRRQTLASDTRFDDLSPAWSPANAWIAFARRARTADSASEAGIWIVRPDGSGLRRVAPVSRSELVLVDQWTPDGRGIAYLGGDGAGAYSIVDVASGAVTIMPGALASLADAAWRREPSVFAASLVEGSGSRLVIVERAGQTERAVVSELGTALRQPRWDPVSGQLLYLRGGELFTVDPASGARRLIPTTAQALSVAWSSTGDAIVYAAEAPSRATVRAVRIVGRGGTQDRQLHTLLRRPGTWSERSIDLASVFYR